MFEKLYIVMDEERSIAGNTKTLVGVSAARVTNSSLTL